MIRLGIYQRKVKAGLRYYYSGQYLGVKYFSRAIYKNKGETKKAERHKRNEIDEQARRPTNDISLYELIEKRLDLIKETKSLDYYKENKRYFRLILNEWGKIKASEVSKQMVNSLLMKEGKRLKAAGKGKLQGKFYASLPQSSF